ncbi:uncharacterized protein CLUP02_10777 [Colletotrichum lupini]|uniref:Uncharacterized protein n=1 Tax=Colletotrichum lupini TaxID=145971 RepID=A0A9Q8WJV8_9PEZI|nr:uncharacterized protein CLUP02_10777 [Colletotrichum lupini]UQC85280.1 hypothetical protein CLUP02_10777 [Colletotrichum lupini]
MGHEKHDEKLVKTVQDLLSSLGRVGLAWRGVCICPHILPRHVGYWRCMTMPFDCIETRMKGWAGSGRLLKEVRLAAKPNQISTQCDPNLYKLTSVTAGRLIKPHCAFGGVARGWLVVRGEGYYRYSVGIERLKEEGREIPEASSQRRLDSARGKRDQLWVKPAPMEWLPTPARFLHMLESRRYPAQQIWGGVGSSFDFYGRKHGVAESREPADVRELRAVGLQNVFPWPGCVAAAAMYCCTFPRAQRPQVRRSFGNSANDGNEERLAAFRPKSVFPFEPNPDLSPDVTPFSHCPVFSAAESIHSAPPHQALQQGDATITYSPLSPRNRPRGEAGSFKGIWYLLQELVPNYFQLPRFVLPTVLAPSQDFVRPTKDHRHTTHLMLSHANNQRSSHCPLTGLGQRSEVQASKQILTFFLLLFYLSKHHHLFPRTR